MMKKIAMLMAIVSMMLHLCACDILPQNEVQTIDKENVQIAFSWWGNDDRHVYTMDGVDLFEEKNPEIKVSERFGVWSGFERRNRVWMESKSAADVMQINYSWIDTYSPKGEGYYDLNKLTDYIDLSNYDESDLKYGMKDGKLNAIPIALNTQTVCFNKELLEEYNLEYPQTWDDLFAAAKVVSKDGRYVIGMPKKHLFLMFIAYYEQTTGKKFYDENGKLLADRDDIGVLVDYYKDMIVSKTLMPIEEYDRNNFGKGECLGSIFWVSDADNYCGTLADNGYTPVIGSYFMDKDAELSGIYMKPATMYAINANTEHPEESAKLLNFLVSDKEMAVLQGTEKGVPINKSALDAIKDKLDTYGYAAYQQMQSDKDKMNLMITQMEDESVIDLFMENAAAYVYDASSRDEVVDIIYDQMK